MNTQELELMQDFLKAVEFSEVDDYQIVIDIKEKIKWNESLTEEDLNNCLMLLEETYNNETDVYYNIFDFLKEIA